MVSSSLNDIMFNKELETLENNLEKTDYLINLLLNRKYMIKNGIRRNKSELPSDDEIKYIEID